MLGHGEAPKHADNGRIDLTYTGAVWSGPRALEEAGVSVGDIDYASIYDSFTITVLMTLEDLGFCEKGEGGAFVRDGTLVAPDGRLPFNTDGGGLCNNHPANRGGMTKIIEAVRQLREEAHPALQVPDCALALAHGTGGSLGTRMGSADAGLGEGGRLSEIGELPVVEPSPNADDAPFWEAAARDRLVLPRCRSCATFIWYPRGFCPACHTGDVEWVEASGLGTVYSLTVAHAGTGQWSPHAPFVIAYVELDEGPRVLTNIVGTEPGSVSIGDQVAAVFEAAGTTKLLRFRPA